MNGIISKCFYALAFTQYFQMTQNWKVTEQMNAELVMWNSDSWTV